MNHLSFLVVSHMHTLENERLEVKHGYVCFPFPRGACSGSRFVFLENAHTVIPQCLKFNLVLGEWVVESLIWNILPNWQWHGRFFLWKIAIIISKQKLYQDLCNFPISKGFIQNIQNMAEIAGGWMSLLSTGAHLPGLQLTSQGLILGWNHRRWPIDTPGQNMSLVALMHFYSK